MLLTDQPSGDSCSISADVSPECGSTARSPPSQLFHRLPGGENESEADAISPLALSREESEQSRHLRDFFLSSERTDIPEAILTPAKTDSQYYFPALEAALRYANLGGDYDIATLNLDPNPPPLTSPSSLDTPSAPSPLDFDLDLESTSVKEKDHELTSVSKISPTEPTVTSPDHEINYYTDLLLDLEFEDYSDVLRLDRR